VIVTSPRDRRFTGGTICFVNDHLVTMIRTLGDGWNGGAYRRV
jgi:hypothetical protein